MSHVSSWVFGGRRSLGWWAWRLACVLALALALGKGLGAPPAALAAPAGMQPQDVDLVTERGIFIDRSGLATIDTIAQQSFEPVPAVMFYGWQHQPVWLRLRLKAPPPNSVWWLSLGPPFIESATLYEASASGGWRSSTFGNRYAFASRPVPSLNFVTPLRFERDGATTVYLQLRTPTPMAEVRVQRPESVLSRERSQVIIFTLYFGIVAVVLVVSILAFASTRLTFWLSTAAYDLGTSLGTAVQSGLAAFALAPHTSQVLNHLHPAFACLQVFMGANLYAHIGKVIKAPVWIRWYFWSCMAVLLGMLALQAYGRPDLALLGINVVGFLVACVGALILIFSPYDCDPALARAAKIFLCLALAFVALYFGPAITLLSVDPEWRRFTAMPANAATIAMSVYIAFRLSSLEARQRHRLAQEARDLQQRKDAAVAQSEAKSAFLVYMSHEIRTPLNAVVGLADLASGPGPDPSTRDRYLNLLKESADSLTTVIANVLDLSKIEAGKLDLDNTEFNLDDWLDALHATYFTLAQHKGLKFEISKGGRPLGAVRGDPVRLRQVLGNFLSNALKFTDAGTVSLVVNRPGPDTQRYRFEVQDTGRGLTEQERQRLFTPYAQAGSDANTKARGTGMGLAICRDLARLMGGDVGVTSEIGRGSCFWIEVVLPEAAILTKPSAQAAAAADALKQRRILVADDDSVNRLMMDALLRREGAEPLAVADGEEALAHIQQAHAEGHPFDIVFLDIHMAGMGGVETVRRIRQLGPAGQLPVVALTGSVLSHEWQEAMAAGMDALLTKPVRLARLREAVHIHAGHRHGEPPGDGSGSSLAL